MAQFKVGQRVRIIRTIYPHQMLGKEATIYYRGMLGRWTDPRLHGEAFYLDVDGFGRRRADGSYIAVPTMSASDWIAPLTDPDSQWADEQIAKLKRDVMKPIEISPKQMEEVRG